MSPAPGHGPGSGTSSRDAVLNAYATSLIQFKARQLTRRRGFNCSDQEDLQQQLALHLLNVAHHYDPARGSINTFIARAVDSCVAMILRHARRQKRGAGARMASLDDPVAQCEGSMSCLASLVSHEDAARRTGAGADDEGRDLRAQDVHAVLATLPPDLIEIAHRLMGEGTAAADGGFTNRTSVASIARDLGISRRQVRYAIERLRRRFEEAGFSGS